MNDGRVYIPLDQIAELTAAPPGHRSRLLKPPLAPLTHRRDNGVPAYSDSGQSLGGRAARLPPNSLG